MALTALLLIGGGVIAGLVGSAGGVTTLVSYPLLLAVGVPPLPANVVNLVAGVSTGPGAALSSRPELRAAGAALGPLIPAAAVGSLAGAWLLLVTPAEVFARVVPLLVAAGSVLLLAQPALTSRCRDRRPRRPASVLLVAAIGVYGGYFGAGSGVMTLAVVLVLVEARVPVANAIKNILVAVNALAAAALLIVTGPVLWGAVVPLGAGLLVGSAIGPVVVRRLPPDVVRYAAAACGFVLAVHLWLSPG